jgi:outer membrane protein
MKKYFLALAALLCLTASAFAQQPPAAAAKAPAALPKGKVAVLNTAQFQQEVGEYKAKYEALNKQFEPRVREVQGIGDRITALENTIKTQGGTLSAAKVAEMTEQIESMKRDYQRKSEDLQADGNRATDRALEPIKGKLMKFAEQYTAKNGIVVLIDLASAQQAGAVLWFDPRTDVTKDFINEYNKANPVSTGAPAPAKP